MNQVTAPAPPPIATMRRPPSHAFRPVKRLSAAPTPKSATPAIAAASVTAPASGSPRQERRERQGGARGEREEREDRGAPGRAEVVRVQPEFLAGERVERRVVVLHEFARDAPRLLEVHAARGVDEREFLGFFLRVLVELVALEPDLVLEHLALRAHRDVLARRHRQRAREQARDAGW